MIQKVYLPKEGWGYNEGNKTSKPEKKNISTAHILEKKKSLMRFINRAWPFLLSK